MICRFENTEIKEGERTLHTCARCGRTLKMLPGYQIAPVRCRGIPFWWELGHWITLWLGVFGVSKAGVDWLARRLRLGGCGCDKRVAALNTIGERFAAMWKAVRPD